MIHLYKVVFPHINMSNSTSTKPSVKKTRMSSKAFMTGSVLSAMMVILYLALFDHESDYTALYNTYNPTTFGSRPFHGGVSDNIANNKQDQVPQEKNAKLQPVENLFNHDKLLQRINNDINNYCPINTFINDAKIRQLPTEEQIFHKTMLKKWIMLYNSMGFKVNILHYNDAIENPRLKDLISSKLLFNKKNQINENYLKLLAYESQNLDSGLYSDYTIFPMTNKPSQLDQLRYKCENIKTLTRLDGYEYQLFQSDKKSLTTLLNNLIEQKDSQIEESKQYNEIFADYSIKTMSTLLHSKNTKSLSIKIPQILDNHLRSYNLISRFTKINIVDPISISKSHYFTNPISQLFQTLTSCDSKQSIIPPPTKQFIQIFDQEIKGNLPDPITIESSPGHINRVEKLWQNLIASLKNDHGKCKTSLKISVTNKLEHDKSALNLVFIPHPVSIISALKLNDPVVMNGEEAAKFESRNFLLDILLTNFGKNDLKMVIKEKRQNFLFFNSELINKDFLLEQLSTFLGFELQIINDQLIEDIELYDGSKFLSELIHRKQTLPEVDLIQKLDDVKDLVLKYNKPMTFILNERQPQEKLEQMRSDLKELKFKERVKDPKIIHGFQKFENRHDPIVEISENFNKDDSEIWHLVQNVRFITNSQYKLMKNII